MAAVVIPANRTVYTETKIHIITCARCAIDFGIGADFMRRRREDHAGFYCPNGHSNYYSGDNEEEQLRKRVKQLENTLTHTRDQREAAERSARAHKGVATRIKNRVAKGVCPCCNRTFENLARHMVGQHPDWTAS